MPKSFRLRKTKIVATVGPACDDVETLVAMLAAGMNVARLNLSFGTFAEHKERLARIREAARRVQANVAIMIDTRGIEVRTGKLAAGPVEQGDPDQARAERGSGSGAG